MADRTLQSILGTPFGVGDATPQPLGTAAPGVSAAASRDDHAHALPTAAEIGAAAASHGHVIADVTGLQTALDAKLDDSQATAAGLTLLGAANAAAQRTALNVANGATANATDASLRDRATHTGSQAISTVTGLQTALDGKQASDAQLTSLAALVYAGNELRVIRVNAAGDAFELATPSSGGGTPDFILQSFGVT